MDSLIISVVTLGCKVNQCESASIVATLKSHNLSASEGLIPADVYVLNTCSVTAEADKKSRQYITKMRKLNHNCNIIVVGCSTQNNKERFVKPNVIAIGGTTEKSKFVLNNISQIYNNHYNTLSDRIVFDENIEKIGEYDRFCYENYPISQKTRAFVKIQDGCNRFCTYCIIPYLRGRSRSRSVEDILQECASISSKEIVLTGIDVSYYGRDIGLTLSDLLNVLSNIPARKRLGSLECEVVDERLLDAMAEGEYCPHFHLSLQSGNDSVLRSMNRHYNTDFFFDKIELIRKYFPLAGITTDVIVGFPTETDQFFNESVDFIKKCAFSDIHVFPYSSRAGTIASKKYTVLSPEIVKRRTDELLSVKKELRENFFTRNLGVVSSVYVEDKENGHNVGYTPNYIKVYSGAPCGEIVYLKLEGKFADGMIGKIIDK